MTKGPDFSKKTSEILAKRAAQLCSNPNCLKKTSGPHSNPEKAVNKGEAAHIRGARPRSARYDPSMTDEQRSDITNGIWLCVSCASEIDKDEGRFDHQLLHIWKKIHEDKVQEVKTSYDIHGQEEFQRLQRENTEIRQQLKAKEGWENRKKQYRLVHTDGGATVWKFSGIPEHYSCTRCFEEENVQILQDQNNVAGTFQCPGCKTHFQIKPMKSLQKLSAPSRDPLGNLWNKKF
jgi:hypothetical protein